MKNRCVIVGGAGISDYARVRRYINADDFYIFCDCGMRHAEPLGALPNLIVGDFDSSENPQLDIETIVLPRAKDDTDTVYAVKEAVRRGYRNFLLVGAVGGRLDHTLGNVSILLWLDSIGARGKIVDDYSEMEIISQSTAEITDDYPYFSLLNVTGTAQGVTITGAKFPLNSAEITCEYQYGISNEVLPGQVAKVSVENGKLLLIKICGEAGA